MANTSAVAGPHWRENLTRLLDPVTWKWHHEAEDASEIPEQLREEMADLKKSLEKPPSKRPHPFVALKVTRNRCPWPLWKQNLEMLSIEARMESFSDGGQPRRWRGPSPEIMALAGWYWEDEDTASCPFCPVMVCDWEPGFDPWTIHSAWCSACPYLKMQTSRCATAAPTAEQKKLLRHSFSSVQALCRPC